MSTAAIVECKATSCALEKNQALTFEKLQHSEVQACGMSSATVTVDHPLHSQDCSFSGLNIETEAKRETWSPESKASMKPTFQDVCVSSHCVHETWSWNLLMG